MSKNKRILVVDDNRSVHEDFKKILCKTDAHDDELDALEEALFEKSIKNGSKMPVFKIDDAFSGIEAIELVEKAKKDGDPYVLIFMDIIMTPEIDGVETMEKIWEKSPEVEMVVCSAYSDYSIEEIKERFGNPARLRFLQKPFSYADIQEIISAI